MVKSMDSNWENWEETENPVLYNPELYYEKTEEELGEVYSQAPFDPNLIDIDTKQPTISNIIDQIANNEIDLSPAFQRSSNLWDRGRQSRLIESILLRIPLPAFYFDVEAQNVTSDTPDTYSISNNIWHVIDGLQRLTTLMIFMIPPEHLPAGVEPLKLTGLEFLPLEGKGFADLPAPYQRLIKRTQLNVYLIKPGTPENVKFNIFKRVNTGGVPLTQQEIRHALNQGIPADFLEKLANSQHFKDATLGKIDSRRMLDREYVNRFLAFYLQPLDAYEDLDSFLNNTLKLLKSKSQEELDSIREIFFDTLDTIHKCFGKFAFCKLDIYPKRKPLNKVLFEVLTVSVAKLTFQERLKLQTKNCLEKYIALFQTEGKDNLCALVSVGTADKKRAALRYRIIADFLREVIND